MLASWRYSLNLRYPRPLRINPFLAPLECVGLTHQAKTSRPGWHEPQDTFSRSSKSCATRSCYELLPIRTSQRLLLQRVFGSLLKPDSRSSADFFSCHCVATLKFWRLLSHGVAFTGNDLPTPTPLHHRPWPFGLDSLQLSILATSRSSDSHHEIRRQGQSCLAHILPVCPGRRVDVQCSPLV